MDNIYIGFSTPKSFNPISWLIRKLTKSTVSHAWICAHDDILGDIVIEASEFGFRIVSLKRFEKSNKILYIIDPKHDLSDGVSYIAQWLGSYYDFVGVFGMLAVLIGRWLKRKINNPFNTYNVFCSEAVVKVLKFSEYPCSTELMPDNISAKILLEFLLNSEHKVIPYSELIKL